MMFGVRMLIAAICALLCYGCVKWYQAGDLFGGEHNVPGVVIGKNVEQYAHGKYNRNMSTRYVMAVKPNDQVKFHNYSVYVDYATYVSYNTGDHIQFNNQSGSHVLRNYEDPKFWSIVWWVYLPFICGVLIGIVSLWWFVAAFVCFNDIEDGIWNIIWKI